MVDTNNDPLEISVYQRNQFGQPEFYVLKKNTDISAGRIVTKNVVVGDPVEFFEIRLGETNVISILDIYDSDGNRWYETDYLAQDIVPIDVENIFKNDDSLSVYKDTVPTLLSYMRTSKRFVTNVASDNTTTIQFGAGTNIGDNENVIPSPITVGSINKSMEIISSFDPSNFLSSRVYGQAPANTTLTIRYVVGGGIESNVNASSITNVAAVEFFGDIMELPVAEQNLTTLVRKTLRVNNPEAAIGGMGPESNDDIRNNAIANFSSQKRAVTKGDYEVRTYAMPSKYGSIAKVYATTDSSLSPSSTNPFSINLYVLCYDKQQKLTKSNDAIRQNLKNYLNQYRMMTDSVNILDGYIINVGVEFSVIAYKNYSKREVLANCISTVQSFFDIRNTQFYQPINLSRLELEIARVEGVQSVVSLSIKNLTSADGDYSVNEYDISRATVNKVIYPSLDPAVFEVKYPSKDIQGSVV